MVATKNTLSIITECLQCHNKYYYCHNKYYYCNDKYYYCRGSRGHTLTIINVFMCIISDGEIDYLTISILLSAQKNASRPSHIHLQPADHKIIRPPPSQTGQCISTSVHAAAVQTHRGLHPYYMPGARLGKFTEPPETPGP